MGSRRATLVLMLVVLQLIKLASHAIAQYEVDADGDAIMSDAATQTNPQVFGYDLNDSP